MLHQGLKARSGRRRPQLLEGDGQRHDLVEVAVDAGWPLEPVSLWFLFLRRRWTETHMDSFLIRSRKESSSSMSGWPWKK